VRAAGVSDERLLRAIRAIRAIPRAGFVPVEQTGVAYQDRPIPIAHGQVTTQPSLSAAMIESLALTGGEHVLEVGTGLGFQTALLAHLAGDVVSVDLWPDLVAQARQNLARQGICNVGLLVGDGSAGAPEHAPYDDVLVCRVPRGAAAAHRPTPGGRPPGPADRAGWPGGRRGLPLHGAGAGA